jgi:hypothetical protein
MNLLSQLATLGDPRALAELRALTSHDGQAALAQALGHRTQWGDMEARTELADRRSADPYALLELRSLVVAEHGPAGWDMAVATHEQQTGRLLTYSPMRSRAKHYYRVGDLEKLGRLREAWSDTYIGRRSAVALPG